MFAAVQVVGVTILIGVQALISTAALRDPLLAIVKVTDLTVFG
jgi:hypothetical protein